MKQDQLKIYIKNAKERYKRIQYIECPAFPGERIHFTNKGFNHLLKRDRRLRPLTQQFRRVYLLQYVSTILKESQSAQGYRKLEKMITFENKSKLSTIQFWSFKKQVESKLVIVIICQINNESKSFLSVMDKKLNKNRKVPEGTSP